MTAVRESKQNLFQRHMDDSTRSLDDKVGPSPLQRPVARSAHGVFTPPADSDPQPKAKDAFTGRPVTHSAVSPSKNELPRFHADPCLQPIEQPTGQGQGVNIMAFSMSSINNELIDEARMVNESRAQYENIISEQRRKSNLGGGLMRSSLELDTRLSPKSNFGSSPSLEQQQGGPQDSPSHGYRLNRLRGQNTLPVGAEPEVVEISALPNPLAIRAQPPGHRRRISNGNQAVQPRQNISPSTPSRAPHHRPNPPSRSSLSEGDSGIDSGMDSPVPGGPPKKQKRKRKHLGTRIKVCLRKRPLNAASQEGGEDVVENIGKAIIVCEHKERIDLSKYTEKQTFQFDDVFDDKSTNEDVFQHTARPLLDTFFQGGNASCFAYGQTGSGKTHTMLGHRGEEGLYLLAAKDLFNRLLPSQRVLASFYEIYCNTLYDLLNERKVLFPREANRRVNIVGLSEHVVEGVDDLLKLMEIAERQRSSGATAANELSSRSHAILSLVMTDEIDDTFEASFKFIDLAGSERGADTAERGKKTQQEGAEINKSLLALKECIRGLDLGHQHIKFRGSKLTEVLRDSFTGNCRTVMIATLSPSSLNVEHTLNTLRYANRVKGLPIKSIDPSKARNQPTRRRSTSAGVNHDGDRGPRRDDRRVGARGKPRRSKSVPSALKDPHQQPAPIALKDLNIGADDSDEDLFSELNIPPAALAIIRARFAVKSRITAELQNELAALKKTVRARDVSHKQEIEMCKMVKRMDEQRISLLEGHNSSLQKKIQDFDRRKLTLENDSTT